MRRITLMIGLASILLMPGAAGAAAPDGPGPWADAFEPTQTQPGPRSDGTPVPPPRNNPQNAVGPAETPGGLDPANTPPTVFYSLGIKGTLTLRFDNPVCNTSGGDFGLDIREVTYAPPDPRYPEETAKVFVSKDGTNYTLAASRINRDSIVGIPSGLEYVRYVKIEDTTDPKAYAGRPTPGDGIDIDGVKAQNTEDCGTFSGRASAVRVTNDGLVPLDVEPSVANGPDTPCATDSDDLAGFAGVAEPVDLGASAGTASTTATSTSCTADSQVVGASIGLIPADDGQPTSAASMTSQAEATCQPGSPFPTLSGSSSIVDGNFPVIGSFSGSDAETIGPIPGVGTIYLNRQQTENTSNGQRLIVRAFEFDSAFPLMPNLSIVLGEAIANYEGEPCPG